MSGGSWSRVTARKPAVRPRSGTGTTHPPGPPDTTRTSTSVILSDYLDSQGAPSGVWGWECRYIEGTRGKKVQTLQGVYRVPYVCCRVERHRSNTSDHPVHTHRPQDPFGVGEETGGRPVGPALQTRNSRHRRE